MTETQRRIKAYQEALPALRERVIAVALLLVMSASMLSTASFAWLTLSRSPEVTAVNTTVAANGNLEIALAAGSVNTVEAPGESKIGDSSAAENQSVTAANITWGNLVNLSDPAYGLEKLTLRPAQLNRSALLTSPLYGATYGQDGRTETLSSNFAYATWMPANPDLGLEEGFQINDRLGVRAITSVTVEAKGFAHQVYLKREAAESANNQAGSEYLAITQNKAWMDSLAVIMGTFLTAQLNDSNPSMEKKDVANMRDVFGAFVGVYETQIDAMVKLANYQLLLLNNNEAGSTAYTEYTVETLMDPSVTESNLKTGVKLTGLNQLKKDYASLKTNYAVMVTLAEQGSITYEDMKDVVNSLINIGTCTINGTSVNGLAADKSAAISMVLNQSTKSAVITNGVLYNFEKLNGTRCDVKGLKVPATYILTVSVTANITTNAPTPAQFATVLEYADSLNHGSQGEEYAQDTYGLAMDLWLRTNAKESYLTLEGNVLTETEEVYPTITVDGEELDLYTVDLTMEGEDGESMPYSLDVYQATGADGASAWFDAATYSELPEEALQGKTPVRKVIQTETVIGYEGENRVWDDWKENDLLSTDATTQGSGSCYVYYADTPEDQARSLALLEAFNVAFVNDKGELLATASMDTERFYASSGRVIVPLALDVGTGIELEADASGNVTHAIMPLAQNTPTRIMALVYLDGTKLTNQDVLAAADIQGQLNIQFGSSEDMTPVVDQELASKVLRASASVDVTEFDYDTATGDMISTVTVKVEGDDPSTVTGFFMREINSTQGSREETITFTKNDAGEWVARQKFTVPGNYVLRTLQLNGIDYVLENPPRVQVKGFAISSLTCPEADGNRTVKVMTAGGSKTVNLNLKFATNDPEKMPKSVQGRYLRTDGTAVNVNFTYNPTSAIWTGSATFVTSGVYTMQYLLLDGEYTELDSSMWQTADVTLGMRVAIYTDSPTNFKYVPDEMADNQKNLYMKVMILDNAGKEMPALSGAHLYYAMQGAATLEKGLSAPLTWDGTYYTCTFQSKVGMFNFSHVSVGDNALTNATTAPRFQIASPEPPAFNSGNTEPYQFVLGTNNAVMRVLIDNCEAATVYADILKSGSTQAVPVQGNLVGGNWTFEVPKDASGKQDGHWTIQQLRLWDVYAADGTPYTEENPLVFSMDGVSNVTTKAVSTVNVVVNKLADSELGKDGDVITAGFLEEQTVSGVSATITDFEGGKINGVSVVMSYSYNNNPKDYGGYTSNDLTNALADVPEFTLTSSDGLTFIQKDPFTVKYAGSYTPKMSYIINGNIYSVDATNAAFSLYSAAPTVTVTDISPAKGSSHRVYTGIIASDGSVSASDLITGDFNRYTDYNATVYIYGGDNNAYNVYTPTVKLKLSGMPTSGFTANMTFGNAADSSYAQTYSFTSNNQEVSNTIGGSENGAWLVLELAKPKIYPAGKQTVRQIEVVYNNMTLSVELSHEVTINQPQYPPYVEYKDISSIDSTYTGTTPSRVYSEDGETITITLPTIAKWSYDQTDSTPGTETLTSDSTADVYTTASASWGRTQYTYYTRNTKVYTSTGTATDYKVTKEITGWKIGGTVYKPGDTVTLTGNQTITAVITETHGAKTVSTTTVTRTVVTFTKTGETSTGYWPDKGSKVDSVTNYEETSSATT